VPDPDLEALLRRPAVNAAAQDLGLPALGLEDVLGALRVFGSVKITVNDDAQRPYTCVLEAADGSEHGSGRSVLTAAVACWADALEAMGHYSRQGVADLERFLGEFA
jgi:hypothetical protein